MEPIIVEEDDPEPIGFKTSPNGSIYPAKYCLKG